MTVHGALSISLPLLSAPWALPFLMVYGMRQGRDER